MSELLVQKFLRDGKSLEDLKSTYNLLVREHNKYKQLKLLKYDQIRSPMADPLVQQCRGIILDANEDWRVISWPFNKFWNHGEHHAQTIDWSTAMVQEKLDGSMCTIYYYEGAWHVATSGTPDGNGQVHGLDKTFASLFWETFRANDLKLPPWGMVDLNFVFELMTPYNRIVVPHKTSQVKLIGVRNRYTGAELSVYSRAIAALGYPTVESFPLTSIDAVVSSFSQIDGLNQEGYVVVDAKFNRNKVKHPQYVALHALRGNGGPTPKRMLSLVVADEESEILTYFPEWKPIYDEVKTKFNNLVAKVDQDYKDCTAKTDISIPVGVSASPSALQKEFASYACKTVCPDALFKVRAGKCQNIKEYLIEMDVGKLGRILSLKDEEEVME